MINLVRDIRFEFKVWWLRFKRDLAWMVFNRKWKREKKKYPSYDRQEFYDVNKFTIQIIDDQLENLISFHWLDIADRWNIPVPKQTDKDHWEKNELYKLILTRYGVSSIRKSYFELRLNSQSMIMLWLTFWVALVAAAGTVWQLFHPAK